MKVLAWMAYLGMIVFWIAFVLALGKQGKKP
jgi:hypothetical protein